MHRHRVRLQGRQSRTQWNRVGQAKAQWDMILLQIKAGGEPLDAPGEGGAAMTFVLEEY